MGAAVDAGNSERAESAPHPSIDFALSEGDGFDVTITPRPGTRVVELRSDTTRRQRDISGVLFDLSRVLQLCKEYILGTTNGAAQIAQDALWMTAVVLYARCFNKGVRQALDVEMLGDHSSDARRVHQHIVDLRDKFIGHSVNSYEQTVAYGVIDLASGEIESHGTTHFWANPMDAALAEKLERLAHMFYDIAERDRSLLGIVVGVELAELDLESIAKLPDLEIERPSVEHAKRRRGQR